MDNDRCMIALLLILLRETNDKHVLMRKEIQNKLENEYEIKVTRKIFYRMIKNFEDFGIKIIYDPHHKGYYLKSFIFSSGEIMMLCNAVHNCSCISIDESDRIIKKLQAISSRFCKRTYTQNIFLPNNRKIESSHLSEWIELLAEAIERNVMVCFDYMHYSTNGKLKIVNHSPIVVEPRFLICQEDGPYIVVTGGIYPIMHYRIDKIANLRLTSCSSSKYIFSNMDATTYAHKKYFMFSDDNINVTFRFRARILDYMIELFGADIILVKKTDDDIETTVNINKTGALLLAQQYSDVMEIIYPESLIEDMRDRITNLGSRYGMNILK